MATAEQIKALIKSHYSSKSEQFNTVVLQLAAHEAKKGHKSLATDIRKILDIEKKKQKNKIIKFPTDLKGLILTETSDKSFSNLIIKQEIKERLLQLISEFRQQEKLKQFGLNHKRKILLVGNPGTGKTMTASVIAHELKLPINTIQVDRLVTKFMGETSSKLRQIFDYMENNTGVYLFDEFDAIGGDRSLDNDIGEMRRVLNSFLQFIEQDNSNSIIVAATNNPQLLDNALFRRFDDVIYYENPENNDQITLIKNILGSFLSKTYNWDKINEHCKGLSHSEIDQACKNSIKTAILSDKNKVTCTLLLKSLKIRQNINVGIKNEQQTETFKN